MGWHDSFIWMTFIRIANGRRAYDMQSGALDGCGKKVRSLGLEDYPSHDTNS